MVALRNPATGHQIQTDDTSAEFWRAAGYRDEPKKAPASKPAPSKKSSK